MAVPVRVLVLVLVLLGGAATALDCNTSPTVLNAELVCTGGSSSRPGCPVVCSDGFVLRAVSAARILGVVLPYTCLVSTHTALQNTLRCNTDTGAWEGSATCTRMCVCVCAYVCTTTNTLTHRRDRGDPP